MKTLSEACEATFIYSVANDEASIQAATKRIVDDIERLRSFDDDVRNCPFIQAYVANILNQLRAGTVPSVGEAIFATACQMIQVGMAMNAPELPNPVESVPGRREPGYTGI